MPKWEEKELFKEYCEDYNTGTLAHKKYYDYDAYVRVQAAKDAKKSCASPTRVVAPLPLVFNAALLALSALRYAIRAVRDTPWLHACRGRKGDEERTTFNDEDERRRQIAQQRADEIESRKKQAYNELRYTTNKVCGRGHSATCSMRFFAPMHVGIICCLPLSPLRLAT